MRSSRLTYTLRALAFLLRYPDAKVRALAPQALQALADEGAVPRERLQRLQALVADWQRRDGYAVEAEYVDTFDRGRSTSLHLFEHVHGDSRDRGPAMIDLLQTYEAAGLQLRSQELPDHLPVLLEFASTQPPAVARSLVAEVAHIVNAIIGALQRRRSAYAEVLAALLEACGQRVEPAEPAEEPALDASWEEPEAFGNCPSTAVRGHEQPVQFVRRRDPAAAGVA
ncbi:nitrate reductase molybdenum cofactor assembly chaperone [Tepidimonas taiwanensis]|uniref:Nitrate reductase molybdenum cofactor assembly chaperone NarJ n=1 Tax=Tepidimonas taiwanensis TaxID=307486 RepID=A0A554X2M2_9BURK|nr:nitrate reductase molybdenum cofactor assembly chaperone [Tepidimonas taiwanensis]TSE30077.1 Nitrate reductase molybdenum cofactor assembly chaperone NarJ [Tepidimonas taiwanensis]UBQ06396.1 nitrate reductase molybdenum cofactor assembly chaperone [Tepidimonas taiwanensis]